MGADPTVPLWGLGRYKVKLEHPMHNIYGGYFNYHFTPIDTIFWGEFARWEKTPVVSSNPALIYSVIEVAPGVFAPVTMRTYEQKTTTRWAIGANKNFWMKFLSPSQVGVGFEWEHLLINGWDANIKASGPKSYDMFVFVFGPVYWMHGKLNPLVIVAYNPPWKREGGGVWLTQLQLPYTISKHMYAKLTLQTFLGDWKSESPLAAVVVGSAGAQNVGSDITMKVGFQW